MNDSVQFLEAVLEFGVFIIEQFVEFCVTSFCTAKYDCLIKATEIIFDKYLRYYWIKFFISNYISNHIIKYD